MATLIFRRALCGYLCVNMFAWSPLRLENFSTCVSNVGVARSLSSSCSSSLESLASWVSLTFSTLSSFLTSSVGDSSAFSAVSSRLLTVDYRKRKMRLTYVAPLPCLIQFLLGEERRKKDVYLYLHKLNSAQTELLQWTLETTFVTYEGFAWCIGTKNAVYKDWEDMLVS